MMEDEPDIPQIQRELGQLQRTLQPRMGEFCSSWAMIGLRAGTGNLMVVTSTAEGDTSFLEDAIVAEAHDIIKRRERAKKAGGSA